MAPCRNSVRTEFVSKTGMLVKKTLDKFSQEILEVREASLVDEG